MNLTSKRMLQFIAGCASACALSAAASSVVTNYVKDAFEDGSLNLPASQYKQNITYTPYAVTSTVWNATSGDASKLVAKVGSYVGTRPITNDNTTELVLNLETEGQTLTRVMDGNVTNNFFSGAPVYVDTLIKFTPSEDNPTISDANVKAAVFVNVSSNLVVYHGNATTNTSTAVGVFIDPTQWYRLTILLGKFGHDETVSAGFQVYVGGVLITNATAYTNPTVGDPELGGTWFLSASYDTTLSAVAFQGTGMVDDLVVTSLANGFTDNSAVMLTLSFDNTHLASVVYDGNAVANNDVVPAGKTLAITAGDWYNVASVSGTDVGYTGTVPGKSPSGLLTAPAATTVTITAAKYNTGTVSTGAGSLDAGKLSTWALAHTVAEGSLSGTAWYDDYLFNVAVGTNPKPVIQSIVLNPAGDVATITVGATATVDFTSLNGTLVIYTADALGDTFAQTASFEITGTTSSTLTVDVQVSAGNFIKAVVQ